MLNKQEFMKILPTQAEVKVAVLKLQKASFEMQKILSEQIRVFLSWKDTAKTGLGATVYWGSFFDGLLEIFEDSDYDLCLEWVR